MLIFKLIGQGPLSQPTMNRSILVKIWTVVIPVVSGHFSFLSGSMLGAPYYSLRSDCACVSVSMFVEFILQLCGWSSYSHFIMTPFTNDQIWAKSWWSTHCFSYRLEGLELTVSSPGSEHFVTYQTRDTFLWRSGNWNKGHIFRLLEWAVYWAKDWGLRVLHWLPSNFYLTLMIYLWLISLWVSK